MEMLQRLVLRKRKASVRDHGVESFERDSTMTGRDSSQGTRDGVDHQGVALYFLAWRLLSVFRRDTRPIGF